MGKIKRLLRLDLNRDKENWIITLTCIGVSSIMLLLMYNTFVPYTTPSKATLIITIVIFVANAFIICMKSFKKMEIHHIAFWTILILGVLSLLIQPVMNIPDEGAHLMRSELTSRFILFPKNLAPTRTIQAVEDLMQNSRVVYPYASETLKSVMDYSKISMDVHPVTNNTFIPYIPQTVGLLFAKLLHVSTFGFMWFGRFANLLAYALLSCIAIKIAPQFKSGLFFVAALPMSIQQAASWSPDAMVNVSVFLLVGYFLYILCDERFLIGKRELILYTLLAIFAATTKNTNVIFSALILVIPSSRFKSKKISFWLKCLVVAIAVIITGAWTLYAMKLDNQFRAPHVLDRNVDAGRQIQYILQNPVKWASYFASALIGPLHMHLQSLTFFGWYDQLVPLLTMGIIFVFGGICSKKVNIKISIPSRIFIAIIAFGSYVVVSLALYLTWTTVGSTDVSGIQGRYFIPLLALVPLILAPSVDKIKPNKLSSKNVHNEKISSKNMTILVSCISTISSIMLILITVVYYTVNPM